MFIWTKNEEVQGYSLTPEGHARALNTENVIERVCETWNCIYLCQSDYLHGKSSSVDCKRLFDGKDKTFRL
jgi:hypothetical protein